MDDLPELPFEKVLSYLSLEDRLKARAVSRGWNNRINCSRVKTLCYSERPSGFIRKKRRWVNGAFAQNFISSTRFTMFFDTFGQTILSSLKHLRLCEIDLSEEDQTAFSLILNSFDRLEELDIIRARLNQQDALKLNLSMLTSLQFEEVYGIEKLTLEAPKLREVKLLDCYNLRLEIVHGESIGRLLVDRLEYTDVKKLKNLQYLYVKYHEGIEPTLLSSLQQLKEIHLLSDPSVSELFEQKRRYERVHLKIYFRGLLLNGPDDPTRNALRVSTFGSLNGNWLVCLEENRSRLADLIPFCEELSYSDIEKVATLSLDVDILKRFTDLNQVRAYRPVQDTQRFLDLLTNLQHISSLEFRHSQSQDLFDRLPEHLAVQKLFLYLDYPPSDLAFLFRLKHLIVINLNWPIDIETIRRAFEKLPLLFYFEFWYLNLLVDVRIDKRRQFEVTTNDNQSPPFNYKKKTVSDLNAAIEFIIETEQTK